MVGIVILNYNTWNQTIRCIESILKQRIKAPYTIYLVDNASEKKMPEKCRTLIEQNSVELIRARKNKGYAAGNNLGIRKALVHGCDAFLISNNDVVFEENMIDSLYLYLQEHSGAGIVGPKVLMPNGKMQETNLGCKMTLKGKYLYLLRKTPFRRKSMKFVSQFRIKEEELKGTKKVFGVSGCCFMISKAAVEKIGLLDENTFLFEEENILGCQMEQNGYDVYLLPEVSVVHKHGQTTKYRKAFSFLCLVESEIYYCRKYLKEPIVKILPLYLIRLCEYVWMCFKEKDYRSNVKKFVFQTTVKMWGK